MTAPDTPDQTRDYKHTLFLPRTEFPMRAGLPNREPEWLAHWQRLGIYDRLRAKGADRPPFILHDGPPYANGHLHIGHALNKVLKDFITRSQQMLGHDARYVPGWDCHGLPIEWKIEEQYRAEGLDKDAVDTVAFRQECRRFAEKWIDMQRDEFQRLGVTGKWDDPYLTMDHHAEAVIAEEFMKLVMNGSLYQGSKPVMWSPVEKTALAEAEVEYHDKESFTIWVKFHVAGIEGTEELTDWLLDQHGEQGFPGAVQQMAHDFARAFVVIWTTTPWTIPSNMGVVYGPDIAYGLYEVLETPEECWAQVGEKYLIADKLATDVMTRARLSEGQYRRIRSVTPVELDSLKLSPPLANTSAAGGEWNARRDFRAADFVTDEEGTGFVHCAPSHGLEEYEMYRGLGMLEQVLTYNVLDDGSFRPDLPFFGGTRILTPEGREGDANTAIIEKLAETGGLLARGRIKHSYPHSWRSKAPVIYRNTPQWFAAIDRPLGDGMDEHGTTIRERALTSIDTLVRWTPPSGRNRLHSMIAARPDWVLSRQRAWGVPLTCFVKKGAKPTDPDYLLRDSQVNARIVDAFKADGADAWYVQGFKELVLADLYDPDAYDQVFDILDVWFDSGSTHAFVLRDRPDGRADGIADLYLEGTDQHRGWFHSSMLQACATKGRAPYHGVLTHGFTLDERGMKMSKSLGNTVAPQEVIDQYGADILRLWVAQSDYTADLRIGKEILKGVADSYRRLRNTMRFILGNLDGFDSAERIDPQDMPELDRWVLHRLAELDAEVRAGYAAYDFQGVFQKLFTFATSDLSAYYFDIRKDALYCDAASSPRRRAARTVLDLLFHRLTTWLAPILVFTMEDVWLSRFPGEDSSVHLQDFPDTPADWRDDALARKWAGIRSARRVVTAALEIQRKDKGIGASLEAAPAVYVQDADLLAALESVEFADICITSAISLRADTPPQDAFTLPETPGIGVAFARAEGQKCQRCWKISADVGTHAHPGTCARCSGALG